MNSDITLYHNPRCSKSRELLQKLEELGHSVIVRNYITHPLSHDELQRLLCALKGPLSSFVRIKEDAYKAEPFSLDSVEQVLAGLQKQPLLMERPLLETRGEVVVARPIERAWALLNNEQIE
jgi:arsenate reductase (glutaredoxin)